MLVIFQNVLREDFFAKEFVVIKGIFTAKCFSVQINLLYFLGKEIFYFTFIFAVYKWELTGQADFTKTADYTLNSVLNGQGQLTVDGQVYPIHKGDHFILPSDVASWKLEGHDLEMIVSHP